LNKKGKLVFRQAKSKFYVDLIFGAFIYLSVLLANLWYL